MKKMLNTLYVSTQGVYLHQEGETVVASLNREPKQTWVKLFSHAD